MNSKEEKQIAIDELGGNYTLESELGAGGQGAVHATQYDKVLVKLLGGKLDDAKCDAFKKKLRYIKRLDLNHLNISLPKVLITEPAPGYVMELMDEMMPLSKLLVAPEDPSEFLGWYKESGGIKRRILLLRNLAKVIADVHNEGLAYGDISPYNIYVSEDPKHAEIQLIDCDNMTPVSEIGNTMVTTPEYGAPEMIRGESGFNTLTDSWSFAVIAFQLLTLNHPFKGLLHEDGEAEEMDELLEQGELPWICDEDDDSNEAMGGVPTDLVVSKNMMKLCQKAFSGRKTWEERPGILEWLEVLETVTRSFTLCSDDDCGAYFLYRPKCPFCEEKRKPIVLLKTIRWEPTAEEGKRYVTPKEIQLPMIVLNQGEEFTVQRELFKDEPDGRSCVTIEFNDDEVLRIMPGDSKQVTIRLVNGEKGADFKEGKEFLLGGKPAKLPPGGIKKQYALHLGEVNEPHRVILFDWLGR